MTNRLPGFRGEYLWELEIAERQIVAAAQCVPQQQYDWRPAPDARSFAEVFVHVASGNFMLLDIVGVIAPPDLYSEIPAEDSARFQAMMRRNDQLMATVHDKDRIVAMLQRSMQSVAESFAKTTDEELNRSLHFFREETTVRRVYMRMLAHTDEHMGKMIAYLRFNGINPPWPDWRPDRRK
jgi:DinB superfamily